MPETVGGQREQQATATQGIKECLEPLNNWGEITGKSTKGSAQTLITHTIRLSWNVPEEGRSNNKAGKQ